MAIQFIPVKCPACGANLSIESNRSQAFCTYCGTRILIHNTNEYVYRRIDEAQMRQAEVYQNIRMRELELEEKKRKAAERTKRVKLVISLILAALGVIMLVVGFVGGPVYPPLYAFTMIGYFPFLGIIPMWMSSKTKR